LTLIFAVGCAVASASIFSDFKDEFEIWKNMYEKEYKSVEDEITRFSVWMNNLRKIQQHNLEASLKMHTYRLGLNEYSDMTVEEVKKVMNGYLGLEAKNHTEPRNLFKTLKYSQAPESIDWREKGGYVSEVKNQGQCGSCWSFSTTGSLEGQHYSKTGKSVDLSEQNLVDCSTSYGNNGCNGGLMDYAFQYIRDNKGLDTEESYPYEGEDDTCRFKENKVGATDTGFVDIAQGDEDALKQAVATIGPISIAIDASQSSFQLYTDGVYDEPNCSQTQLDHGVLIVGYGSERGKDYWIVKNSWGTSWGEQGYIRMSRNKNNQCGVASSASYPTV
jgi:cathepsin L